MASSRNNARQAHNTGEPLDPAASRTQPLASCERDPASGLPMLTRRSLLSGLASSALAAGGMMLLPKEEGKVLFPAANPLAPREARAEEIWSGTFTFDVVGADQVGIQVLDVSGLNDLSEKTVEKQGKPVHNALITLTSLYNSNSVSEYTDDQGKAIIPIKDLAFSTNPPDGVFRANCKLKITTKDSRTKMRDFSTGRVSIEGATGFVVGVHELEDNGAYIERCTFDDWDIHYSKLTFLRSGTNAETHTIELHAHGMQDGDEVELEVIDADKLAKAKKGEESKATLFTKTAKVAFNAETQLAECTFEGKFLKTGADECISADDAILRITLKPTGAANRVTELELLVEDTPFEEVVCNSPILPISTSPSKLASFNVSGDWPCFNGLSLGVLAPFPMVQVSTSIYATTVGFGTDIRCLNDNGKWAPKDNWKRDHKGNIFNRYNNMVNRKIEQVKRIDEANKAAEMTELEDIGNPGARVPQAGQSKTKFLGAADVNVIGRLALFFAWNGKTGDDRKLTGKGTVELGVYVAGSFTLSFMAGPVPMFLSGTLGLTVAGCFTVASEFGLQKITKELDASKMGWSVNQSAGLFFKFLVAISLGVGYKGLCSFSFDATFEFPIYLGWLEAGGEGKDDPHTTIGATILLEFVLQALIFRLSGTVYSYRKNDLYDSWEETKAFKANASNVGSSAWKEAQPRFKLTQPDGSFRHSVSYDNNGLFAASTEDLWSLAVPVTDAMMKVSKEADASTQISTNSSGQMSGQSNNAQAIREAHIASFVPADGFAGTFFRDSCEAEADPTTVFVNKMPRAVLNEDGSISTELVDCEGNNTFFFGGSPEVALGMMPANSAFRAAAEKNIAAAAAAADKGQAAQNAAAGAGAAKGGAKGLPRFEGDPLLGFGQSVSTEYSYSPVSGKTTFARCDTPGVMAIANQDGVKPSLNVTVYQNAHSDPRQRVVTIDGRPCLFRIITVEYPKASGGCYCRTRVAASYYDESAGTWGNPTVLEYATGNSTLPRIDLYDYEFDIVVRSGSNKWTQNAEACLVVTGGLRPDGDKTSFHEAAACGSVAVLVIDKDFTVLKSSVRGVEDIDNTNAAFNFNDTDQSMLCSPCIVDGFGQGGASGSLAFTFLRRSAPNKDGLTLPDTKVTFCVGYCYVRDGFLTIAPEIRMDKNIQLAADVFGMKAVAGDASTSYDALLTLAINHQNGYDVCTAVVPKGEAFNKTKLTHCISSTEKLPEIQPWPHRGTFLFVKERPAEENSEQDCHLYKASFDPLKSGQSGFTPEQVDATGLKGASFCMSPSGEFLFYYETFHDIPDDDPQANFVSDNVSGTGDDTVHRIMASRLINGAFCEDFPFCDIDHPADQIEVLSVGDTASSFIVSHITDADQALADMHYIGVPNVISAEVEAFVQDQPFVCAGHPATFSVDVRNHGNMVIGGFKLQMADPSRGGKVIGTVEVGKIDPKKVRLTAANMGWGPTASEKPQLNEQEQQGLLMPGKTISYEATFDIPAEWTGKKTVIIRIIDAWTPGMNSMALGAQANGATTLHDDGMIVRATYNGVHHYHQAERGEITLTETGESNSHAYYEPREWTEKKQQDPKRGGGKKKSSSIPKTGEANSPLGPVAAALGGAVALASAYTARRLENERDTRKENA